MENIPHNTTGYRNYKCRCDVCKKAMRDYKKGVLAQRRLFLRSLKEKPCADCGVQYPWYVMQFDHGGYANKGKNFTIGGKQDVSLVTSWKHLVAEVEKCEVVCANCHFERSYQAGFQFRNGLSALKAKIIKP